LGTVDLLRETLTSPMVLAFVLGVVATAAGSDLRLPEVVTSALSSYLLLAIGLKGGVALSAADPGELVAPAAATLGLGVLTPCVAFLVARRLLSLGPVDAGALAAHYGSVSAVTFAAAVSVLEQGGIPVEAYAPALLALLEVPGIVVGLALAAGAVGSARRAAVKEALLGRSVLLLAGGLVIGAVAGADGAAPVDPLFRDLFLGALTLFLLDLGVTAARRAAGLRSAGFGLLAFGTAVPLVNGNAGVLLGTAAGLSVGGAALLGVMGASASYIAAPAAVRIALPAANPALYLTASLGITFPLNLVFGIPLFTALAHAVA
jgi:uncharacterized protein